MDSNRTNVWLVVGMFALAPVAACNGSSTGPDGSPGGDTQNGDITTPGDGSHPGDSSPGDGSHPTDSGPDSSGPCTDMDMDGISDTLEGRFNPTPPDTDMDGTPDWLDTDSDGDGISDLDEGHRNYMGYSSEATPALTCGDHANNCSPVSGVGNWRNLDSDGDGLSDHEEVFTYMTDPCNPTTHTDPVTGMPISDLVWAAAGGMAPPPSSLYVTLPYSNPDPNAGCPPVTHTHRQFDFATRFHSADIFFVIDTTGSMGGTITTLQSALTSTIIPGILSAIGSGADVRMGAADYRSFPQSPDGSAGSDYIVHVGQPLTRNFPSVQSFINSLAAGGGGDYPECTTEALEQSFVGDGLPGIPGHDTDGTVQHGCAGGTFGTCSAPNLGWAQPMDPIRDCGDGPDDPPSQGFGCFQPGRVPILVQFSDAQWVHDQYDNCDAPCTAGGRPCTGAGYPPGPSYSSGGHTFANVAAAFVAGGAYFVGVDVGAGDTHCNAVQMATLTGTLDGSGTPIAPMGAPGSVASVITSSVATLVNDTKQDVSRRIDSVPAPGIAVGHMSSDFIQAVTPARAEPPAPAGYDHSDATTFYGVDPATIVTFDVDFYNDFQPAQSTLQLFQATIVVIGRAGTELDRHAVYIVVPSNDCTVIG